ncbi:S-adenosylmethionine--2-demethylmenaquinone methyltransferase [Brevibacterium casei]|uniref:4-hydroxy-4-methyl-2-oxoglutarate aldolase n=1 Tax=Brevibacterium casei TaxID=33889 RepID=A0A269ZEG9_9MICO|nr:ribonuclease E activity regulator RraA [Brevibacterium casei]PAK96192.1 S-adenosylmethionine--2-demethylmenaquinone methyltransferase [Brevibacterium casei]
MSRPPAPPNDCGGHVTVSTADLWDERGPELHSIALNFTDFGDKVAFSGPARTVRCFEDNALVRSVLSGPGDGSVLVVDGGGSIATALMGDMIAELALSNGWVGVVINGAVRDREVLATLDLGVKALASNPRKSGKTGDGEQDIVVEFGGATIRPGAMVFADADGVVVER